MNPPDLTAEDIRKAIFIRDLPDHLPRRAGKRIADSTVYRWTTRGIRGVRLETICIGSMLATWPAALTRFFERIAERKNRDMPRLPDELHDLPAAADRRRAIAAERELVAAGF